MGREAFFSLGGVGQGKAKTLRGVAGKGSKSAGREHRMYKLLRGSRGVHPLFAPPLPPKKQIDIPSLIKMLPLGYHTPSLSVTKIIFLSKFVKNQVETKP